MEQTLTVNARTDFNTTESTDKDNQDVQPPAKRFRHLKRISKLLDDKEDDEQENEENNTAQMSKEVQQMYQYIECRGSKEEKKIDPFEYWLMKKNDYPDLSQIACEILATPASTAPVE